jgi:hypothetical protein
MEKNRGIRVKVEGRIGMEGLLGGEREVYKHRERRHLREVHLGQREDRGKRCGQ